MDELVSMGEVSWDWMNPSEYVGQDISWYMCAAKQYEMNRLTPDIVNKFYHMPINQLQLEHLIQVVSGVEYLNLLDRMSLYITDPDHQPWIMEQLIWSRSPAGIELFIDQSPTNELKLLRNTLWQLLR